MQISVRFFTRLREIIGKREEQLQFSDNEKVTINIVLETLVQCHGERFGEYIYDLKTGAVRGFLQFLINGKSANAQEGLQTELKDGDVLAILPPVGGG